MTYIVSVTANNYAHSYVAKSKEDAERYAKEMREKGCTVSIEVQV